MNADLSQMARAVSPERARWMYFAAAVLFAICIYQFGHLGLIAKSLNLPVDDKFNPAAVLVLKHYGTHLQQTGVVEHADSLAKFVAIAFSFVILVTFAVQLDGAGNLFGNEAKHYFGGRTKLSDEVVILMGRIGTVIPVFAGIAIAVTNPNLIAILSNLALVRGPFLLPFIAALFFAKRTTSWAVSAGIIIAVIGGVYITMWMPPENVAPLEKLLWQAAGAGWALLAPAFVMFAGSFFTRTEEKAFAA